jgi:hypothetical protein
MRRLLRLTAVASIAALAACQSDVVGPSRPIVAAESPSLLVAPGEGMRTIQDTVDAAGNTVMVVEYAAGTYVSADSPEGNSVASVTIRTVIPRISTGSSGACITSTIEKVETIPGWTASIKKPGGCDKTIEVSLENTTARQKAVFSFLYIFGKTRIDFGAVR